jgi:hypothetical protein
LASAEDSYVQAVVFFGSVIELKLKNQVRLVVVLTVFLAVLLLVGLSIALQQPLYVAQSPLSTTYNTPFANVYWMAARFNNSQGSELAFFNFAFRYTNQSQGPVLTTLQFGPESSQSIYLDSAKFTFTSDPLSWPDIGLRVPTNGFTPTQISRVNQQTVILSYQNMGFYGQGTELFDIWFGLNILTGATNTNHSVFLTVDLTGHNPHALLIGQSYTAEAIFQIVTHPNGLLTVSDTAY